MKSSQPKAQRARANTWAKIVPLSKALFHYAVSEVKVEVKVYKHSVYAGSYAL